MGSVNNFRWADPIFFGPLRNPCWIRISLTAEIHGEISSVQVIQGTRSRQEGKEITPAADLPPPPPDSMTGGSGGRRDHESDRDASTALPVPGPCASTHRALAECHRRAARGPLQPEVLCRHLNRALAECVVTACCPDETDAVRTLCGSAGTALKRQQCQRARIDLALCLEAHQEP